MIVIGQGVVDWVSARALVFAGPSARGIGLSRNGKIIAGIVYIDFNGRNVMMHQAVEGPVTRTFMWTIFDYPFNQLKVDRVTGIIPEGHIKARRVTEHAGFTLETRFKDAHPSGDLLVYVMRRDTCRWTNENLYKNRLAMAA